MFTNYRYKNLPERQLQEIITHCLSYSSNNEHNLSLWHVGLTVDSNISQIGKNFKLITCTTQDEAFDLKRYLTFIRGFKDDGSDGQSLYVYKE